MTGRLDALEHPPVDQLAREPHSHPGARHRRRRHRLRDDVVEDTVEVRKRNVDSHAGDGVSLGRTRHRPDLRLANFGRHERQLLGTRRSGLDGGHT